MRQIVHLRRDGTYGPPVVEGRLADPVLAAQSGRSSERPSAPLSLGRTDRLGRSSLRPVPLFANQSLK